MVQVAVTESLLDRLEDCKRTFPTVAVLGGAGDVVTSRLSNGRAGITKVLQMDISPGMLLRDQAKAQVAVSLLCNMTLLVHHNTRMCTITCNHIPL